MDVRTRLRNDLMATVDLPYGSEAVDQLTHALQAGTLAVRSGARPELVAAALLHDIGRSPSVADELPGVPHERIGATYCRRHLGHEVGGSSVRTCWPSAPWSPPSPATSTGSPRRPCAASRCRADLPTRPR